MKITAIKQQVKNPERVSIFVDDKYEFSLNLDELLKEKLRNGSDLEKADIKRLKKLSADGKLRQRALEWLLNRPRSEREFRDYLYRKKAEPEQTEKFIKEFTSKNYLDNQKFAEWFVELQTRRSKSDRAIRAELYKKGISRELADEVLASSSANEEERLRVQVAKKIQLSRYRKDPEKLMRYLVGQGFSWAAVKQAVSDDSNND